MSISPPSLRGSPKLGKRRALEPSPITSPESFSVSPDSGAAKRKCSPLSAQTSLQRCMVPPPPPAPLITFSFKPPTSASPVPPPSALPKATTSAVSTQLKSPSTVPPARTTSKDIEAKEAVIMEILNRHQSTVYSSFYSQTKAQKFWDSKDFQTELIKNLKHLIFDGSELSEYLVVVLKRLVQHEKTIDWLQIENENKSRELFTVKAELTQEFRVKEESLNDDIASLKCDNYKLNDELNQIKAERDQLRRELTEAQSNTMKQSILLFEKFMSLKNKVKNRSQNI